MLFQKKTEKKTAYEPLHEMNKKIDNNKKFDCIQMNRVNINNNDCASSNEPYTTNYDICLAK